MGYAACLTFSVANPLPAEEVGGLAATFVSGVAQRCREAGATVIGHIKALVETASGGTILVSLVGTRSVPRLRQEGDQASSEWQMTLNVLVYGLTSDQVAVLVRQEKAWLEQATGGQVALEEPQHLISKELEHQSDERRYDYPDQRKEQES